MDAYSLTLENDAFDVSASQFGVTGSPSSAVDLARWYG